MYGFSRKVRKGDDYKAYYHELFLRGRFDLCKRINRVKSSDREERSNQNEPDFSKMIPVSAVSGELPTTRRQRSETPKPPPVENANPFDADSYPSIKLTVATREEYKPSSSGDSGEQDTRKRPTLPVDFHYLSSKRASIRSSATADDLPRREVGLTNIPEHSLESAGEMPGRELRPHYLLDQAPAETMSTKTQQFLKSWTSSSAYAAIQRRASLPHETTQPPYDQSHTATAQGVFDNYLHFRSDHQETPTTIGDIFPSLAVTSLRQQQSQRSLPTSLVSFLASPAASAHTDRSFDILMNNLIDQELADPLAQRSLSATVTANVLMNQGLASDLIMYPSPAQERKQLQGQESDSSKRKRDASISNFSDDNNEDGSYEEKRSMVDFLDDIDLSSDDDGVIT